nr:calcium uniporter protein 2, mitochondrial-like [Ipomoea batatas]
MEFKKNLARQFLRACRFANPNLTDCRISTSRVAVKTRIPPGPERISHDKALDDGVFRRFMHRPSAYRSVASPAPAPASFGGGEKLLEKLRGMDISRDRIRLEGLIPPPEKRDSLTGPETEPECNMTTVEARKLLRLSQLERVKMILRGIEKNHISYSEFIGICRDACSDSDQGLEFAKTLDDSGAVIVLGNVVFLKPHQESDRTVRSINEMAIYLGVDHIHITWIIYIVFQTFLSNILSDPAISKLYQYIFHN